MPYRIQTPEERERIRERLRERPTKSKDELRAEIATLNKKVADLQWAYDLTEGILRNDPKWFGVNERNNDEPILAAKLAKSLIEERIYRNRKIKFSDAPDPVPGLIEWLQKKPWRTLRWVGDKWIIRDEALGREVSGLNLNSLLLSDIWIQFSQK